MRHVTSADLIAIHALLIAEFGGMPGITEMGFGRLEGAAATPSASAFGQELFPDPLAKAAVLCYAIVRGHPFSDGNKRVALLALDIMLTHAGLELTATNDQAYATIMALANGSIDRDALVAWVHEHCME